MKPAIVTQPARLVRAFWNVEQAVRYPDALEEAVATFLLQLHEGLVLGEEPLVFRVGGTRAEPCTPYSLFVGYRGGAVKVVGLEGHPDDWVLHNAAVMASQIASFPPGFWGDPKRAVMLLAHHVALATGRVWQRALVQGPEIAAKWAFLSMVLDDHTSWLGPLQRQQYKVHAQRVVNENLPRRLLGLGDNEAVPGLVRKRCRAITEHATQLPPIVTHRRLEWTDLTPLQGQAVSRRLAYYFTREDDGPRLSVRDAGQILGMDARSVRRGAKAYEQALMERGPKDMRFLLLED